MCQPTKWVSGTLDIDIVDPRRLLTLELESQFEEFDSRIWAVADWDHEVPPRSLYPFPIRWNYVTEEDLRELGVIKEHITDKDMPKPLFDKKKTWLVMLFRGELTYSALK